MTAAVEVREERIRFAGAKLADRMKDMGLNYQMLADAWEVIDNTARNAVRWPSVRATPPAQRIEKLERALELPIGTLLDQHHAKRPDPNYWEREAGASEPESQAKKPDLAKKSAAKPARTSALAVPSPASAKSVPVFELPTVPAQPTDSPLKRRIAAVENVVAVLVAHLAEKDGTDPEAFLRGLGIAS